ncbi:MAG TPA: cytochrome c family protein [Dongiaceae bacterium]|jgi:cytochrome c|nr:cytochrome c family protein [Dongiaceae bacterium]
MASLEVNKVAGAILLAALVAMVTGFIAHELVNPERQGGEAGGGTEMAGTAPAAPAAPAPIEPVSGLLAKADASAGQQIGQKCAQCHDFTKGGPNKVGPNLWGIVGSHPAEVANYAFSDAMKARESKTWTYEELNDFLTAPKVDVPGTKMTFPGLPKLQDRADVIAWLRTLSDAPAPLPSDADIAAAQKAYDDAKAAASKPAAPAATAPAAGTSSAAPAGGTETGAAPVAPIAERLKTADVAKGEQISKKCMQCHDFNKGGPNKIGPNLWGIVGSHPAEVANYSFSDAMQARKDKTWTFEELDAFLAQPKTDVPGTKMTFPGLPKPEDRADIIAWLRQQSDAPVPLP